MPRYFKPEDAFDILLQHHEQIVSVVFTKRTNNEERQLTGIMNCKRYVKGVGLAYDPADKNLMTIFDLDISRSLQPEERHKAYRSINMEMVSKISAGGKVFLP